MTNKPKFRYYFAVLGLLVAFTSLFATAPGANLIQVAFGAEVISKLSSLPAMVFAVLAIWVGSKALYDYIDLEKIISKATETPEGAAQVFIGVNIGRVALALLIMGMIATFS